MINKKFNQNSWESFQKAMEHFEKAMESFNKDFNTFTDGWRCPKCNNVYAPHIPMCMICNMEQKSDTRKPEANTSSAVDITKMSSTTSMGLHNFVGDGSLTPKCVICGLEKWQHPNISFT